MSYLDNLNWQKKLANYDNEEKKVLLALSHENYKWRTTERLTKTTGLPDKLIDTTLSGLISKGEIRASFSKNKNLIFGLKERIG